MKTARDVLQDVSGGALGAINRLTAPRGGISIEPPREALARETTEVVTATHDDEGFGKGVLERRFPPTSPAFLNSFFFKYSGVGSIDHHLTQIIAFPDLPERGKILVGFHDKNSDDEFYFHTVHHLVKVDSRITLVTRGLDLCTGSCIVPLSRPSGDFVFVLRGFQFAYRGTDHHVDEVGLIENDGRLSVRFNDRNDDDLFLWRVKYAWVPRDLFSRLGESHGAARGGSRQFVPRGPFVIRGFHFNFSSDDHHIRDIGVFSLDQGSFDVFFEDKNQDDRFGYMVKWGILK